MFAPFPARRGPSHDLPKTDDQPDDDARNGEDDTDPPPQETLCVCRATLATNKGVRMHRRISNAPWHGNKTVLFTLTITSACVGCGTTYKT